MEAHTISWCCSCLCGACRKGPTDQESVVKPLGRTQSTNLLNCDDPKIGLHEYWFWRRAALALRCLRYSSSYRNLIVAN